MGRKKKKEVIDELETNEDMKDVGEITIEDIKEENWDKINTTLKKHKKIKCPICGKVVSSGGFAGHMWHAHRIRATIDEAKVLRELAEHYIKEAMSEAQGKALDTETKAVTEQPEYSYPTVEFGKDLKEDFIEHLKFAGLTGGHWPTKRIGIAELFFAGEQTPERLYWAMKKAGANPLQIDLMLHLWFKDDKINFHEVAKKAEKMFEKKKEEPIVIDGSEENNVEVASMDVVALKKLIKETLKELKNEEDNNDIWKKIDKILAWRVLERALRDDGMDMRSIALLKVLGGSDNTLMQKVSEIEKKIADEREKTILETLIKSLGESKKGNDADILKMLLEYQLENQKAMRELQDKAQEMRFQSLKEYLDKVLNVVAARESWDEDLKNLIKQEMTKTLVEKLKSGGGKEKSKAEIAKEVIETTIERMKEPVLKPLGQALAENVRRQALMSQMQQQKQQTEQKLVSGDVELPKQ